MPIALKEWAVAVQALRQGKQIIIMRKGGIREETKDFQIESDAFFLFPTYEHQKSGLLKPEHADSLQDTLKSWEPGQTTTVVDTYAELAEDIEISDQADLDKLAPFHIWTDSFAEERLKWKRNNPLHVMVLRVYSLEQPATLSIEESYNGCKSWIQLNADLGGIKRSPVLSDAEFSEALARIKQALRG
ncbi:DUF1802 family protein [Paenibacillus hamazuiensis]|uniref:DUF1802 family protein n=1 Tax=Paenibacillus hamazuiensis TaxID=2936508 RepID=UPI00200F2799|nr:DUF1802 family protein [Paenibacillus hamazuiensis]